MASKLTIECTASTDNVPTKITPEDYNKFMEAVTNLVGKYNFDFEGGGFYIEVINNK